jgi:prevent-host-death family protein
MREMSVREANQNFSRLISEVERGEIVIITKNGRAVAKVAPQSADRRDDPEWRAAHDRLMSFLRGRPDDGYRVGAITEDDKYGPLPG